MTGSRIVSSVTRPLVPFVMASLCPGCVHATDELRAPVGIDVPADVGPLVDPRAPTDNGWPRVIKSDDLQITVYQPQVESWTADHLRSRAAVVVQTTASALPSYGIVTFTARTEVDRENRLVTLADIRVEATTFPSEPDRSEELAADIRHAMPTDGVYIALDRLEASLAVTRAESRHPTVHVRNDVPRIVLSETPAVLVLVDGQPVLRPVPGTGLLRVINTRSLLLFDSQRGEYYLAIAGRWMRAGELSGPWSEASDVPTYVVTSLERAKVALSDSGLVDLLDTAGTPVVVSAEQGVTPAVYVSTRPAEMIQTAGAPQLQTIPGTGLLEVQNSASDVFMNTGDQRYYVLLSGRWFRAPSLERGPWEFVSAKDLPADFARIPETHPRGAVLASVPGTPEAEQAIIANEIPQTATVQRSEARLDVTYDGAPQWRSIEGTSLTYAVNSATPVIGITPTSYYAVDGGVWFTATSPQGPWLVATSVPDAIDEIPPSSPLFYVTFVHVYDSTPEVVYDGYTPGYLGSYVTDDDLVVYGTGYVYPCWADTFWVGSWWTFGFDVGWAPGFYWAFDWGFGAGLAVGLWPGMLFHPWWGPAGWGWGHHNARVPNYHEANLYRSTWGPRVVGEPWERHAEANRSWLPSRELGAGVFAGRDGQVYRTTPSGGWQRHVSGGWQEATPPPEVGNENQGRQRGSARWQLFRGGGGYRGGTFHGGIPRR